MSNVSRRKFIQAGAVGAATLPLVGVARTPFDVVHQHAVEQGATVSFCKDAALQPALNADGSLSFGATGVPSAARYADEDTFWDLIAAQYPVTEKRIYFNTGGLGPAPATVIATQTATLQSLQATSETGHRIFGQARDIVAPFFGCNPAEIAFMRNATEATSTIASGLELEAGDEVIFETHAHPGGSIPWMSRRIRDGIRIRTFEPHPDNPNENVARIERLITRRTRVIQISHITAPTGIHFPVPEIAQLCADHNIWFHIDGAQSAGMVPIHLHDLGCDSFATSGHKWMGAPHGTGVLFVKASRLDDVTPTEVGAYSDSAYDMPDVFEYSTSALRYESGTRDAASVAGMAAAVRFLTDIGIDRVAERSRTLALRLQAGIRNLPGLSLLSPRTNAQGSAITTIQMAQKPYNELFSLLMREHNMRTRVVTEEDLNALRISTHIFNTEEDIDALIEALTTISAG